MGKASQFAEIGEMLEQFLGQWNYCPDLLDERDELYIISLACQLFDSIYLAQLCNQCIALGRCPRVFY